MASALLGPAAAQDTSQEAPSPVEEPRTPAPTRPATPASPILVIRQSALFSESIAARSIANQAAAAENKIEAELDVIGESLRERERELSVLRSTLPKEEFDARAAEFERDVRVFYARSQRERGIVDQAVGRARAKLRREAERVLIEIMRRHGALVMLDEEQVVLSVNSLDITQEAIDILNQRAPDVELVIPTPSEPAAPSDP